LGSSVEAGSRSQSANPQLQTIAADATTKTTETTKVGTKPASGAATLSYIAAAEAEEQSGLVEYGAGAPRDWTKGFARLHPDRPPGDVPPRSWQTFVDDCGRFLDTWAAETSALGWDPLELFGCDGDKPFARIDQMGLLWFVAGGRIVSISMSAAVIARPTTGARQTYRPKKGNPERALVWELV
jgi:hypothetical protein